jgi:serine/threonine protein kinase
MGIDIIKVNNRRVVSYRLPSIYKKVNNNIGNKLEDFEILQVLGSGSFGFVAKVKSKINLEIYALKKNNINCLNEIQRKKLKNEIIFLKKLDHPNVCGCLGTFEQDGCYYIIMKLFSNKDLFQYLYSNQSMEQYIKEENLWDIFNQCLSGLSYLHGKGIIHRDIKPGNILMNDDGNLQIGDFGISLVMDKNNASFFTSDPQEQRELLFIDNKEQVGTPNFVAPEIEYHRSYDQKSDVYSMGICFYGLTFYELPYRDGKFMDDLFINNNNYSYELRDIIFQMIQIDKSNRATSGNVYTLFKKYYIKKYVKNSGIYSVVQCLFSFQNFKDYFTDSYQIPKIMDTKYSKKLSFILLSIVQSIKDKENVGENIYNLRKIMCEEGFDAKDNIEISPLDCISFIINLLNYELNEKENVNYSENKTEVKGDEKKVYENFINTYKNNFCSLISKNFPGVLKVERKCNNCNTTDISFERFHFISFKINTLTKQNNCAIMNIYDCFEYLNKTSIYLGTNKCVSCSNCKKNTEHMEKKTFYSIPNNLIIMFDRGSNKNKKVIDFYEKIKFKKEYIEKDFDKEYTLVGIITEIELFNGKYKYISFIKNKSENCWYLCDNEQENAEIIIQDFNEIKNAGNIISLFYYYYDPFNDMFSFG